MPSNPVVLALLAGVALIAIWLVRRNMKGRRTGGSGGLSLAARIEQFVMNDAVTYISLGLILYSFIAQVFVRSNGGFLTGPLGQVVQYIGVFGPGTSFSLFEFVQIRSLNEMRSDGVKHSAGEWASNIFASVFTSAYNFINVAMLDRALDPDFLTTINKHAVHLVRVPSLNELTVTTYLIALGFTGMLFFAGFVGHKKLSGPEELSRLRNEIVSSLVTNVRLNVGSVVSGQQQPGKEYVALIALGNQNSSPQEFLANLTQTLNGTVNLEDALAHAGQLAGVIEPGLAAKLRAQAQGNGNGSLPPPPPPPNGNGARTPEQMDQLRAQVLREGYPLPGQPKQLSESVRRSLIDGTRRDFLRQLTGMTDAEIDAQLVLLFPNRVKQP